MSEMVTRVDFVALPTKDLPKAVEFYGETLGLERSVYLEERNYAEFETGNLTISVIDAEKMGLQHAPIRSGIALHVDDVASSRATLEERGDWLNAAHARYLEVRRLLLIGRLDEAEPWLERAERTLRTEMEPATGMSLRYARAVIELARGRYQEALTAFGGAEKWAVSHGLSKSYVNQVLRGARQPGGGILHALKMRLVRVDYYESEEK